MKGVDRGSYGEYYLPKVEIEDYSVKIHCVKSARTRSFSSPCFPAFGPNTGI